MRQANCRRDRLLLLLEPVELTKLDNFLHAARLGSRSDAIRHLMSIINAIDPNNPALPIGHLEALRIMRQFNSSNLNEGIERTHLCMGQPDLEELDNFRHAARFDTRSEAVVNMIHNLLDIDPDNPKLSEEFLLALRIKNQFRPSSQSAEMANLKVPEPT